MQVPLKDIVNIIIAATLFIVLLAGFIVMLVKLFDKARKNFALERENINKEFETQILRTQLEIQEQTFQNISQEIHDNIGQVLSFVKLNINTIDIGKVKEANEKLLQSKDLLTKTIQDLRNLSKILNTDFIKDIGLVTSVEYQLSFLEKTGAYKTELNVSEAFYKIPPHTEIILFRIIQELLNNVVKHAEATAIAIKLDYLADKLQVTVKDNGKGFDYPVLSAESNRKGLGLKNLEKRIAMVRGTIKIQSEPGKGTHILMEIPRDKST